MLTNIFVNSPLEANIPGKITFYFNEEVIGFRKTDIDRSGVSIDEESLLPIINNKREYIWRITPREIGTLNLKILANSFEDFAGNFNTNIVSTNLSVNDTTPPTVDIFGLYLAKDTAGKIIFTFSEDVINFTKSDIVFESPSPTIGKFITNNKKSYELKITPTVAGTLTVKIDADSLEDLFDNSNETVSKNLTIPNLVTENSLKTIIDDGKIPQNRSILQGIAKDILSYYTGTPKVVAKYVKTDGTGDGSAWDNATNDIKATIKGIEDSNDNKVYLVLVASGDYPSDDIAMKNNVAIIGGWNPIGVWGRSGETRFDGQDNNRVFKNNNLNRTALLYSASIINGNADKGGGMYNDNSSPSLVEVTFSGNKATYGGGIHNQSSSSPTLEKVTFSGNEARYGGGMHNYENSSPSLIDIIFSKNNADISGGGMYNNLSSSPSLVKVTFSGNKATYGGGMHNNESSPSLINVTFSKNTANKGGGMNNYRNASPSLVNVTFSENTANTSGGGVFVYNSSSNPLLVNAILWGNQANGNTNQITLESSGRLGLHYSIIEGGTNDLSTEGVLTSSHTTEGDPLLLSLANSGGFIQTHALGNGSPAIDAGVYVKKSGDNFYFSEDNTTWYTGLNNNGLTTTATPPNYAEDLTATDARGYNRKNQPDIGAYEPVDSTVEEDKNPPTVSIAGVYLAENTPGKIIFTFNEDVKDFTKSDIKFSNPAPTTGEFITNNQKSYELIVTPTAAGNLTVSIDANSFKDLSDVPNQAVSVDLNVDDSTTKVGLKEVIEVGEIPISRNMLKNTAKDVLSYYGGTPAVVARYVKTNGTGDGSSWANAANNPKATINGISDASDSNIYLVIVASGDYPSDEIAMKNNVAIIGGWSPNTEWERIGVTRFDGQGKKRVFFNNNLNRTALLYGATITNGKVVGSSGGGMLNNNSSPTLVKVAFSGNKADSGGGMRNWISSPTLVNITFSGNKADSGGGMLNWRSSPTLINVTFSGNEAVLGGGMRNNESSPTLVNVTFLENTATQKGGGMHIANISGDGPLLVNTIFWGNLTNGVANQISIGKATDKLRLHYSIIQGGTNDLSTEGVLTSSHTTEGDPLLLSLADNGGLVKTHALGNGSPAINKGVYVKKKGTTFYFSEDNTTWYTGFNNNGLKTTATPPNDAEDLTATDARGYNRVDRPDIGAYENGGTAPTAN